MTSIRGFELSDLRKMSLCNLDPLTENYDLDFYCQYHSKWPDMFRVAEDTNGRIVGYIMGKIEAHPPHLSFLPNYMPWHGHVTALTVAPEARRQGLARTLTAALERACERKGAYFMDLFVRESNTAAIAMYKGMGYSVYRRVVEYYSDDPTGRKKGGEDAFDMRKSLARDKEGRYVREGGEEIRVWPEDLMV